jgi:hypothetical protein
MAPIRSATIKKCGSGTGIGGGLLQAWHPQAQVSDSETAGTEMPMVVTPTSDDHRFCDEPDPL